jgi:PAS domain S-box-containing protein
MTILIVDDNEPNLYQLQVLLVSSGYQVVTALNGAEALTKARQNPPDLIVSDILMPVMDGFGLCREWKKDERLRQIPFVFYTATYTDERDREFALSLGAEQFLVKPEEPEVFARTIREVIQQAQRPPVPPAPPAANTPARLPVQVPQEEEAGYLKQYNEVLIRKLEAKMQQLKQANRELERDITDRKRSEEALNEERHLLHTLMDNLPDFIYFKDRESHFTRINKALAKGLGLSDPAQGVGKTDFDFFAAEHAKEFYNDEEKIIRTGQPMVGKEEKLAWPDGQVAWDSTTKMPLRDANGNIIGTFGVSRDITKRKLAEAGNARLAAIVNSSDDAIFSTTREGVIATWNAGAERMYGYAAEEIKGKSFSTFIPEDRRADLAGIAERLLRGERLVHFEHEDMRKDGSRLQVLLTLSPIKDATGFVTGVSIISRDITERKRAEEELYQSRQMLQSILDTIPQRVFWKDRNMLFLGCNSAFAIDAGLKDPTEIIGKNDYDLAWGETAELYRADDKLVMEQETPRLNFDEPQNRPDGSLRWLRTNKLPLRDREGEVIGVIGTYEDITERKRVEAEHTRLVTAIEQAAETLMVTDIRGTIEYVNPAFTRITGYSREEVLGQNPRILKSGKQDQVFYQQLWATILRGEIWHGELINRRKEGNLYTEEMNIAPVRDALGEVTHFIATKQDVTEHKQLGQQLIQAQKMEAVGRLAGGVAHDFNNLLTIINGYAALLSEETSTEDPRRARLKEILMAGERAASLTRQLLAFSRRQVLEPRVLNLNSVLADIEKMLRRLIGEDVELVSTLKPDVGRVKVDPGQIEQVIMNLALNARDAMPEGGKLLIETSNVEIDEKYVRSHSPMMPGKYVMVAVSDTGCGMDLDTQAHIFEPFFTTKEEGRGTGLGLATVYGIVKQSGGFIWVYSEPGRGSTFKIYLPFIEENVPKAKPAKVRTKQVKGSETVLVVEDEGGVRSLVCQTLASQGYKVLEAAGAAQALKISEQHTEPIHLLLTDVVMPQTDGKKLAMRLSTLHPETKVLYMSGYTDDAIVRHGILNVGTSFLQKPFLPRVLLLKIREVLKMKSGTQ